MTANRIELLADAASAQARLVQLGARHRRDKSTATRMVYYVPASRAWLLVTQVIGGGYRLEFYGSCPSC